jgi:predicted nucleic acid-binding protein
LADTSAWIELDRATGSDVHRRMRDLLHEGTPLAVTAPVIAEVAMGARTDQQERRLRDELSVFSNLRFRGAPDLDAGATTYRRCRQIGVTPDGLIDCVIVAIAQREGATLLTADRGQARIAQVMGVDLDPASVQP